LFYGKLAESAGRELALDFGGSAPDTIGDLRKILAARPELAGEIMKSTTRAVVGDMLVPDSATLADVACVEFLPPVSGG
jgi:molybdopterin converting factor small subunit